MLPLKFRPIEIPPDDPFANDAFERQKLVEPLTQLLESVDHPFVFAVTAPWGSGKTTFVTQWAAHLRAQSWHVIDFNAWENDFSDSALATMIAELRHGVDSLNAGSSKLDTAVKKVKRTGAALAKRVIPAAAKLVTVGALDLDKEIEAVASKLAEDMAGDVIDRYDKTKKSISAFRESLRDLVAQLRTQDENARLAIFVDELDRCRPTFALEMLEVMKHLFDVDGIVFVLAVDRDQLHASVKAIYGQGIDATEYLRRFVDMQFALPRPSEEQVIQTLWDASGLDAVDAARARYRNAGFELKQVRETFCFLCRYFPRSVRFYEHLMTRINAVLRTVPSNQYCYAEALVFLLFLREITPSTYRDFVGGKSHPKDVVTGLFLSHPPDDFAQLQEFVRIEGALVSAVGETTVAPYYDDYDRDTGQWHNARSCKIVEFYEYFDTRMWTGWLDYLVRKIELTDHFVDPLSDSK